MEAEWARIEKWLRENAPAMYEQLPPGASDAEIAWVERVLGIQFPDDVKAFYRIHNGSGVDQGFIDGCPLSELQRMLQFWQMLKKLLDEGDFDGQVSQPEGPIRTDWWHPAWIPLAHDEWGNYFCLDLAPADGGNHGQIFLWLHDEPRRILAAPSFRAWVEEFIEDLNEGLYLYLPEEYPGLITKRDYEYSKEIEAQWETDSRE